MTLDRDTLEKILAKLDSLIIRGVLQGNGADMTAQRNGIILAYNTVCALYAQAGDGWRNVALRIGEMLADTGPDGYYNFDPASWAAWCDGRIRAMKNPAAGSGGQPHIETASHEAPAAEHCQPAVPQPSAEHPCGGNDPYCLNRHEPKILFDRPEPNAAPQANRGGSHKETGNRDACGAALVLPEEPPFVRELMTAFHRSKDTIIPPYQSLCSYLDSLRSVSEQAIALAQQEHERAESMTKMCDAYVDENQRLDDRAERAEAEREALRQEAKHWKELYVCAQNANSYRQDALEGSPKDAES